MRIHVRHFLLLLMESRVKLKSVAAKLKALASDVGVQAPRRSTRNLSIPQCLPATWTLASHLVEHIRTTSDALKLLAQQLK